MEASAKSDDEYVDSLSDSVISEEWQDLSKSEYARVIFCDRYHDTETGSVGCKFQITDNVHEDPCDVIGLYKVGYENLGQCHATKMLSETQCEEDGKLLSCVFKQNELLTIDNGFYQFLYVTRDKEVCGASMPFEIKLSDEEPQEEEVIAENIDSDFLMVRFALEKKYEILEAELKEEKEKNKALSSHIQQLTNEKYEMALERDGTVQLLQTEQSEMSELHRMNMTASEKKIEELKKEYEKMLLEERKKVAALLDKKNALQLNLTNLSGVVDTQAKMFEAQAVYERGIARELQDSLFMIKALEDSKKLAMKEVNDVSNLLNESNKALEKLKQENRCLQNKYFSSICSCSQLRETGKMIKKDKDGNMIHLKDFDNALYNHLKEEIDKLKNEIAELNCENLALKVALKDHDAEGLKKQMCNLRCENLALKVKVGNDIKSAQFIKEYEDTTNNIVFIKFSERQREFLATYEILKRLEIILHSILPYLPSEHQSQVYVAVMKAKEVTDDFLFLPQTKAKENGPQNMDELKAIMNQEANFTIKCILMWNYFKHRKFVIALPDPNQKKDGPTVEFLWNLSKRVCNNTDTNIIGLIEQLDKKKQNMIEKLDDPDKTFMLKLQEFLKEHDQLTNKEENVLVCSHEHSDLKLDLKQIERSSSLITNQVADFIKHQDSNAKNVLLPLQIFFTLFNKLIKAEFEAVYLYENLVDRQKKLIKLTQVLSDSNRKLQEEDLQKVELQKLMDNLNVLLTNKTVEVSEFKKKCSEKDAIILYLEEREKELPKEEVTSIIQSQESNVEHFCEYRSRLLEAKEIYKAQFLENAKLKKKLKTLKQGVQKKTHSGRNEKDQSSSESVSSETVTLCKKNNDSDTGERVSVTNHAEIMDAVKHLEKQQCGNATNMVLPDSCKEYLDTYAAVNNIPINYSTMMHFRPSKLYITTITLGGKKFISSPCKSKDLAEEEAASHAVKNILDSKELYVFSKRNVGSNDSAKIAGVFYDIDENIATKALNVKDPSVTTTQNNVSSPELFNQKISTATQNKVSTPIVLNQKTATAASSHVVEAPFVAAAGPSKSGIAAAQTSNIVINKENGIKEEVKEKTTSNVKCVVCSLPIEITSNSLSSLVDHLQQEHNMCMCPVCGQLFDQFFPLKFIEFHVESHFKNSPCSFM